MKKIIFTIAINLSQFIFSEAQSHKGLVKLSTDSTVYFSLGNKHRAAVISERMNRAKEFHQQLLNFKPEVQLLILSKDDWQNHTTFPVYGMPHYSSSKVLIIASEDNPLWKSFIPPLEVLPIELANAIKTVYRKNDSISMEAFFDLLAIHELGHAFHNQAHVNMQRKWMGELFVNILLHTYIAEKESTSLPALTLFPKMVIGNGASEHKYTSLNDIEERYEEIGKQYPKNYGWFQCRWHEAAGKIYDALGKEAVVELWKALNDQKEKLNDKELIKYLESQGLKPVADLIRNWDLDTKK